MRIPLIPVEIGTQRLEPIATPASSLAPARPDIIVSKKFIAYILTCVIRIGISIINNSLIFSFKVLVAYMVILPLIDILAQSIIAYFVGKSLILRGRFIDEREANNIYWRRDSWTCHGKSSDYSVLFRKWLESRLYWIKERHRKRSN